MTIHSAMTKEVRSVAPEATLREAAQIMRELNIGSVPVLKNGRPIGIVTDRDLVIRAIAEGRNCATTAVRDVMTLHVVQLTEEQTLETAVQTMKSVGVSRLLVTDHQGKMVGILTAGDAAVNSTDKDETASLMTELSVRNRQHLVI